MWINKKNRVSKFTIYSNLKERNLREEFRVLRKNMQRVSFVYNVKEEFKNNFAKVSGYMDSLR
jgi:hypothetical protein